MGFATATPGEFSIGSLGYSSSGVYTAPRSRIRMKLGGSVSPLEVPDLLFLEGPEGEKFHTPPSNNLFLVSLFSKSPCSFYMFHYVPPAGRFGGSRICLAYGEVGFLVVRAHLSLSWQRVWLPWYAHMQIVIRWSISPGGSPKKGLMRKTCFFLKILKFTFFSKIDSRRNS